jgi:hypothetical protein
VALATTVRSPKSCVISLRYGVSPQPVQAPENSNRGWATSMLRIRFGVSLRRSSSGMFRKNSQFTFSCSSSAGCGCM